MSALIGIYPVVVMARVMAFDSRRHLRAVGSEPDLLTDFDGAVRLTQLLREMPWPWSTSHLVGHPTGEGLLRWQFLAQGVQWTSTSC